MSNKAVFAVGGNALIKDAQHQSVEDQYRTAGEAAAHIADMIEQGWEVVITHGTGPQVGFILRRSELAARELHQIPLDVCDADAQGAIGYALQQNLQNVFLQRGIAKTVATLITQTEVSPTDPAFSRPSKTIGGFLSQEQALHRRQKDGWEVVEDSGRGWRRVVPSPKPLRIVEAEAIRSMLSSGVVTIAAGGGGIPVVEDGGILRGVAAVIDKDLSAALLAQVVEADLLLICTSIEKVALDWRKPNQRWVDRMSLDEARKHLKEGIHFGEGSMRPKIQAVVNYLENGGQRAIITSLERVRQALQGKTGTHFLP